MATETPSPIIKSPRHSSSSYAGTPLTDHLLQVMDSKPVPAKTLENMRQNGVNLPEEITTRYYLKRWFHKNRPDGFWSMGRVFEAQKQHHAEYLTRELDIWKTAISAESDIPPRGTSSRNMEKMASSNGGKSAAE